MVLFQNNLVYKSIS